MTHQYLERMLRLKPVIESDESRHPLFQCFMKGFIRITQIALESEKEQQKKLYTEATDLQK